jgi:hypothetical protein
MHSDMFLNYIIYSIIDPDQADIERYNIPSVLPEPTEIIRPNVLNDLTQSVKICQDIMRQIPRIERF